MDVQPEQAGAAAYEKAGQPARDDRPDDGEWHGDCVVACDWPGCSAPADRVPTALDFPGCRACQMWKDAGASWPRPCKQHYRGEPHDCGHSCCDERHDPMHDHFLAADNCPSCVSGTP